MARKYESEHLIELIGELYDVGLDSKLWPMLPKRIAQIVNSTSNSVHIRDSRLGNAHLLATTENFDEKMVADYEAYYSRQDGGAFSPSSAKSDAVEPTARAGEPRATGGVGCGRANRRRRHCRRSRWRRAVRQ